MRTVAVALLLMVAFLSGCGPQRNPAVKDVAEIQPLARITIPASASNVRCATEHGIDSLTYGRFDIPAAELRSVLAGMPAGVEVRPYGAYSNVTAHKMRESWWQPAQLKERKVANWSTPGFSVNLLFGEGDPGAAPDRDRRQAFLEKRAREVRS